MSTPPPEVDVSEQDASTPEACDGAPAKSRYRPWILLVKLVIGAIVVVALGRQVADLAAEWSEKGPQLPHPWMAVGWIALATLSYSVGQLCFGLFWLKLLRALGVDDDRRAVLKAYVLGTLGKYVPGKALVVVIRTGLIHGGAGNRIAIALTSLYETIGMIAVASGLSAVCLAWALPDQIAYWGGAALLGVGMAVVLHPIVFGRIAKFASMPLKGQVPVEMARDCYHVWLRWMVLQLLGWMCSGASLLAVSRAVGVSGDLLDHTALMFGAASWATAIGFVVIVMPAGLGVRELLLTKILAFLLLGPTTTAAALLLRVVWTGAELLLAGAVYALARPVPRRSDGPATMVGERTSLNGAK